MDANIIELYPLKVFNFNIKVENQGFHLDGVISHDINEARANTILMIRLGKTLVPSYINKDNYESAINNAEYDVEPLTDISIYDSAEKGIKQLNEFRNRNNQALESEPEYEPEPKEAKIIELYPEG